MSNHETKLDKIHHPIDTIAIRYSKVENPHKNYNLIKKNSNSLDDSHNRLFYHYCCKKGHTIEKC